MAGFISPLLGSVRVSKTGTGSRTGPSGLLLRSCLALVSLVWPWAFGARDWSVSVIVISPADEWQAHSECQLWLLAQGGVGSHQCPSMDQIQQLMVKSTTLCRLLPCPFVLCHPLSYCPVRLPARLLGGLGLPQRLCMALLLCM